MYLNKKINKALTTVVSVYTPRPYSNGGEHTSVLWITIYLFLIALA